jgi:hypothetical protein
MTNRSEPISGEPTIEDWLTTAGTNLRAWEPSPLSELLQTERRDEYQALLTHPDYSLKLLKDCLEKARKKPARPYHIQNIEAPGDCWESGTQIDPARVSVKTPDGKSFTLYVYQLVFILTRALVLDEDDQVRHLCNNRACVRPDHLEVGSAQQNRQDEERRKYAGNSPQGRGQTLHAHVPKHLQLRPDPFVPEPLERERPPRKISPKKPKDK